MNYVTNLLLIVFLIETARNFLGFREIYRALTDIPDPNILASRC